MTWQGYGGRHGFDSELQLVTYYRQYGTAGWGQAWFWSLQRLKGWERLASGWNYGRRMQVRELSVGRDGITAQVQQSWSDVYQAQIRFRPLPDAVWDRVADMLAAEARYAVQLLEGDLPLEVLSVLAAAGASLFPAAPDEIEAACSCPDGKVPCKHIVQVCHHVWTRIGADPLLLLALRGRTTGELLAALRARRAPEPGAADVPVPAQDHAQEPDEDGLLGSSPEAFWRAGTGLAELELSFRPPAEDALPVKQLGHVPYGYNRREFTKLMERAYQAISAHALRLALGGEEMRDKG